jgi:tetratricopeptide (TPR) repeat protein
LISRTFHTVILLLLLVVPVASTQAQKKKKNEVQAPAAGNLKEREAEFYFTEGEKYFILEDYAKALMYYQKALDIQPQNATIHYKIAEVLSRGEDPDNLLRASLSIEQALKYETKNKYFYLLGAGIYSNLTRFDRAAELYETMLKQVKDTEEYLLELAVIYQFANKQAEAIKTYDRAESFFGVNETSSLQKQRLYAEQGKINEAVAEGQKLLNAFPDEEQYAVGFAEFLSQNNQTDKAIDILENFRGENNDAPNASVLLAGLYRDKGEEQKARKLLVQVFDDAAVDISSKLLVLGTYNAELNNRRSGTAPDPAMESFALELHSKLVRDYPQESKTYIIGGDLYLALGRQAEAEQSYIKAIELGEVNFEVWQNLLYLQTQRERFDDVIRYSEKALEYYPNQSALYYFNGLAQLRKNHYQEAAHSLETGKRLSSSNPALVSEMNAMLGDAYNGTQEYAKSDQAYEEALAYNPENYIVLNNYAYYLALRKTSLDKAEKMSSLLIKNNPDNPTFLDTHAWVLFALKQYKDARKVMEKAISSGEANATHFEHYGDILFQLGDIEGAVQQWEKARKLLTKPSESLNKKIANRKLYE